MIKRDYLLSLVEELMQALARMGGLKREARWAEVEGELRAAFQRMFGADPSELVKLSESDILARLVKDGPMQAVPEKIFMMTRLLLEAGEAAAGRGDPSQAHLFHRKGLRLLLAQQISMADLPPYVPRLETFMAVLDLNALSLEDHALIMMSYERAGNFAKAEDSLFRMAEHAHENSEIWRFGRVFFQRLQARTDGELLAGGLDRSELGTGLAEWETLARGH